MTKVAIIGAGVAGLTAAHELLNRGFEVDVFELNALPGGKARSIDVPATEYPPGEGLRNLPAEHGFRFFPGFYRHIGDTMRSIPYPGKSSVADNLVNVDGLNYGRFDRDIVTVPLGAATRLSDIFKLLKKWLGANDINMPLLELLKYWGRMLTFFSSCTDRVNEEYEEISWWDFLRADGTSVQYRRFFGNGSRLLVAADPREASAKTNGMIAEQLIDDQMTGSADKVLSGPTNSTWLFPWARELVSHPNCRIFLNARVTGIKVSSSGRRIAGIEVTHRDEAQNHLFSRMTGCDVEGGPITELFDLPNQDYAADYYIAATPVEVMAGFLRDDSGWTELAQAAPELQTLDELKTHTEWMNGIVFYLKGDLTTIPGHSVYVDTPFALSSIFQDKHWSAHFPLSGFGDGNLTGICSVIASNWLDTESSDERIPNGGVGRIYRESASATIFASGDIDRGKERMIEEVWEDLKSSLRINGEPLLHDVNREFAYIDPAITVENGKLINKEPLLVNRRKGWRLRPTAATSIGNFFLAGDYVRTNTDLATMEAACEAAKQAVNGILDHASSSARRCAIYPLKRLAAFAILRYLDQKRYDRSRRRS